MNAEWAAVLLTACGIVATGVNVFVALSIRGSINAVKLWVSEKFVSKEDMSTHISPLKDAVQMLYSQRRLKMWGTDNG